MVFRLNSEVFEYRIRPKSLHVILFVLAIALIYPIMHAHPVFDLSMADWIMHPVSCILSMLLESHQEYVPDPLDAARASSPMKKSRSSVPLFMERCPPGPAPPVRYEGLFATAGLPDPEPPPPPAGPFVAIAVGKTNEGESLPAKPARVGCQPVL